MRVSDLFKEWDDDDSGSIGKAEFRKAMGALGFEASDADMDVVFDSMDPDGSGLIEYKELNELLRRSVELSPSLMPGKVDFALKATQKHALRTEAIDPNDSNLLQGLDIDETSDKSVPEQACAPLVSPPLRPRSTSFLRARRCGFGCGFGCGLANGYVCGSSSLWRPHPSDPRLPEQVSRARV